MDTTQLLLTIVLSITTLLLIIIGVQVIMILNHLKKTIRRVNDVINGFESAGVGLEQGMGEVVGFMNGFKTILKTIEIIHRKKNEKNK